MSITKMEVVEDCVVFTGTCIGHSECGPLIAEKTLAAGMKKAVIVGDCDDHCKEHEEIMAKVMKDAGIEHIWLSDNCYQIKLAMPDFNETGIRRFGEAINFGKLRLLLNEIGARVYEVQEQIKKEERLLSKYRIVAKLQSIESHDHLDGWKFSGMDAFAKLFGNQIPKELISNVNAVALFGFGLNDGVLVTKSEEIDFVLPEQRRFDGDRQDILEGRREGRSYTKGSVGSIRISLGSGAPEISLYCEPGVWRVKSHPELNTMERNIRYIPMWQRLEKVG